MEDSPRPEILTKTLRAGSRTYFFNIKKSNRGDLYLTIHKTSDAEINNTQKRIMIFEENFVTFVQKLVETLVCVSIDRNLDIKIDESIFYPRAYQPWSEEEDQKLKIRYSEGYKSIDIAREFQRKPSAIKSRLRKLNLKGYT